MKGSDGAFHRLWYNVIRSTEVERVFGTVKWFNNEKGYGFIVNDDGEDCFIHYRNITGDGYKTLNEGEVVSYIQTKSDKGWQANEVQREHNVVEEA